MQGIRRGFFAAVFCAAAVALGLAASAAPPSPPPAQGGGRDILYNGSRVTHVFLLDRENHSYRPVTGLEDRYRLIKASTERATNAGEGQLLIHTEGGRYALGFDPARDAGFAALCGETREGAPHIAQWLAWMDDGRLIRASFDGDFPVGSLNSASVEAYDRESLSKIAAYLKRMEVLPGSRAYPEGLNPLAPASAYSLDLTFSGGITYHMYGYETGLCISSSDMGSLTIRYETGREAVDGLRALMAEIKAACAAPLAKEAAAIQPDPGDIRRVNLYHETDKTYARLCEEGERSTVWDSLRAMLQTAREAGAPSLGAPLRGAGTLEVTRESDGKKFAYRLYENGFTVAGTALEGAPAAAGYTLESAGLWDYFCDTVRKAFNDAKAGVHWLGLMADEKADRVILWDNATGGRTEYYGEQCAPVLSLLRGIPVKGPGQAFEPLTLGAPPPDSLSLMVNFTNGVRYEITVTKTQMTIVSSDVAQGLRYPLDGDRWPGDLRALTGATAAPVPPVTAVHPGEKPVIYLYPQKTSDVAVTLDFDGELTYTYPAYNGGWAVTAQPDGTLLNKADGSTHYYLFWEGVPRRQWSPDRGFVVKGGETEAFLRETLVRLGLTPREYNDFLTYWVPRMRGNPYNLISFLGGEYGEVAKLTVTPEPDSLLRIHMVWQALDAPVPIAPQELPPFTRTGFAVVEWGGTELPG